MELSPEFANKLIALSNITYLLKQVSEQPEQVRYYADLADHMISSMIKPPPAAAAVPLPREASL